MTIMTQEQQGEEGTAGRVRRPATGIAIDPARLAWFRQARGWSRQDLADAVNDLGWTEDDGTPLTITRDAIGKNEKPRNHPDARSPKPLTLRAYCEALSRRLVPRYDDASGAYLGDWWETGPESERVTPQDMMPGPPLDPHQSEMDRAYRVSRNAAMRQFAQEHDIPFRNPETGRIYYSRALQEAYDLDASGADAAVVAVAVAAAKAAGNEDTQLLAS